MQPGGCVCLFFGRFERRMSKSAWIRPENVITSSTAEKRADLPYRDKVRKFPWPGTIEAFERPKPRLRCTKCSNRPPLIFASPSVLLRLDCFDRKNRKARECQAPRR